MVVTVSVPHQKEQVAGCYAILHLEIGRTTRPAFFG